MEYEVKDIIGHRIVYNNNTGTWDLWYQVHWMIDDSITWEPAQNIDNCEDLLNIYMERLPPREVERIFRFY